MIREPRKQYNFQMVCLEDCVPKDHLLRKIDKFIDFSFIQELTRDLYSPDNGRPAVHPAALFKMLFIGYLFGIRSERRLVQEIEVNLAYRWFIGYDLDTPVPNHSTFSQARRRRFSRKPELTREIFENIVAQAINHGLIEGKTLYTDSTHIKANANKNRFESVKVEATPAEYLAELDRDVDALRVEKGSKPFDRDGDDNKGGGKNVREIKRSKTDPESGFMTRDGKPQGFFYLENRTVDGLHGLIVDSHVTPGNVPDDRPYPSRLRHVINRFGFEVESVGVDAGYKTSYIAKFLHEMGIYGVAGYRRVPHADKNLFYPRQFTYDASTDTCKCPAGQELSFKNVDRRGYKNYAAGRKVCGQCPLKEKCTKSPHKTVARHIWKGYAEEMDSHRLTERGKKIYARRKETIERSFADGKEMHGLRHAKFRGIKKVGMQCLLSAACQNMKKIALLLARRAFFPFIRFFPGLSRRKRYVMASWVLEMVFWQEWPENTGF